MSEVNAIDIAKKYADQQGWTWLEPVECKLRKRWFTHATILIRTNAGSRGINIVMTIDAVDGKVIDARMLKR